MLIKALIIIHIWSLVIALAAWVLQRDGDEHIGARFPKSRIWLSLIFLCFLPGVLFLLPLRETLYIPSIEIFEVFANLKTDNTAGNLISLNYFTLYISFASLLMIRTFWRWAKLQCLPLSPTSEPKIFETHVNMPPLTLSWPRRVIVIPHGLDPHSALIQHEHTHLHHHDAEMTLVLLLLQDAMLRSPGLYYLIKQWRLSIELRADHAATKMLTTSERKDYANLLLYGLRPSGHHTDGGALPCPTAHLTSTRHRSVKMRLTQIMQNKTTPRKYRWRIAIMLTTIGATMLGFMSLTASAKDEGLQTQTNKITYEKRVPPKMPARCTGLNPHDIKIDGKTLNINGVSTYMHTADVGFVNLKFDVKPNGSLHNIRITESNHPCFEPEAKASVAQWRVTPQGKDIKDVAVKIKFLLTGETHEEIEGPLNKFLQ